MPSDHVRAGTAAGRWVITAAVLGSGVAFLDATVVNVALPAIAQDLNTGLSGLQWVLDGYLLTLSSLLLLGGSLGDLYGRRRVFVLGLVAFSAASLLCGLAPSVGGLVAARALQGAAGALLVPGSLSLLSASFRPEDRAGAVGAWSGLAGIATAIGPFAGGWLVDAVSWRLVFFVNLPLAAVAVVVALRHVPETRAAWPERTSRPAWPERTSRPAWPERTSRPAWPEHTSRPAWPERSGRPRPDLAGAALATVGLGGLVFALIEGAGPGSRSPALVVTGLLGVAALVAFPLLERRQPDPLLPLSLFRSRQFTGANLTTLLVYAAFGAALFLVVVQLQVGLGYSAMEAGSSLLPITLILVVLSARVGRLAQRTGPRGPMTAGPLVVAAGLALAGGIGPGDRYASGVLPAVLLLGFGMAFTVAPLTSAVMASADEEHVGAASGFNNAVARIGGLLSVAVIPLAAGLGGVEPGGPGFQDGLLVAMRLSAVLAALGGLVAFWLVRRATPVMPVTQPDLAHACLDPCLREPAPASATAAGSADPTPPFGGG